VDVVVVVEELAAPPPGIVDIVEVAGPGGAVLEGLEVRFDVGVVVAHMRTAVCPGHPQVFEQLGHCLGGHGRPPVGVQRELAGLYAMAGKGLGDECLGYGAVLTGRYLELPRFDGQVP
jgi:hypothetical protein